MKHLFLKIIFFIVLFQTQIGFSQDVPINQYAAKMIGKWEALTMDEDGGLVPDKEKVIYDFTDKTTLKIYRNNKLDDTILYKLSPSKFTTIHLKSSVSKDFDETYTLYIHYEDSELFMNFENRENAGMQVFRKKIKK
jgi:hypothetical protein